MLLFLGLGTLYLLLCGIMLNICHEHDLYLADGPHILLAVLCSPISIICYFGYQIIPYLKKKLDL